MKSMPAGRNPVRFHKFMQAHGFTQTHELMRTHGFTLIEVLMVVLLVGIISGIAMLSLNPGGAERQLPDESDRLVSLLTQAADEAVMKNQEYGFQLTDGGYRFLCLDEDKQSWQPCQDEMFRERKLPEGLALRILHPIQMTLALQPTDDDDDRRDGPRQNPDLLLLSSGEASPASLELVVTDNPDIKSTIQIDELGRIHRDEDPDDTQTENSGETNSGATHAD
jgi:general secretion pathway protein H